jgi:quinol monooxygenase YgiN
MQRRELLKIAAALALTNDARAETRDMYGTIVKVTAANGQREALISILLEGTTGMPGCLSYIIAKDDGDDNSLWITEVWDSKASHDASLSLPGVKNAITKGKPLIAAFGSPVITTPMGGQGLPATNNR